MLDVLVIGGGPAGSTLAWALRNSGLKIAIMDKEQFPRQKVCAGWVTPAVMQELDIDLDDYARGRVLQPINGFRISQIGQKQLQSHYSGEPVSYGIRRIEFDHYLLLRGHAELLAGTPFKQMERTDDGWCINGAINTRLVVGAGGHFCPVARAIGAKGVSELAVAAQEVEFEMTAAQMAECSIDAHVPERRKKSYRIIDGIGAALGRRELYLHQSQSSLIEAIHSYPVVSHDDEIEAVAVGVTELMNHDGPGIQQIADAERLIPDLNYGGDCP